MSGEQTVQQTQPQPGHVKNALAVFEKGAEPQSGPRVVHVKAAYETIPTPKKQPRVCPFPGYEGKNPSSIPLVVPDGLKYNARSCELKKVDNSQQRLKLSLHDVTLNLLKSIDKPVSVLAICGPARSGKSYILSRILGPPGAFKLGHTMDPQTYGVWMGTHYLDFGEYAMILLDTEGTDAVGAKSEDDISILLLATLLSSCLIYNSAKVPTETDLQTLECFTRLSSIIAIKSRKQESAEDGDIRQLFPDFLWLLRDVNLQLPTNKQGQIMTPREFMLEDVFQKNKKVGSALESCFPSVDCRILPPPAADLQQHDESSPGGQNQSFFKEVRACITYICNKAKVKNGFQEGERVDGPVLSMLITSYLRAINDPSARPCIEKSWTSAINMRCSQVIGELVEEYEDEMRQKLAGKLPMEIAISDQDPDQPSLMQIHGDILRRMLDKLREATQFYMPADPSACETERRELSEKLTGKLIKTEQSNKGSKATGKVVGGVLYMFWEENEKMSNEHCTKVFAEVSRPLYDEIKTAESDPTSTESDLKATLPNKIAWLQADYFEKAIGPAKETVLKVKLKELEEYGSRVAGFQQMMHEVINREALAEKQRIEELKAIQAAAEEQLKIQENERKKMEKEYQEHMQRVKDDLERKLHDEKQKRKELEGKDIELANTVTKLEQSLKNVEKKQAVSAIRQKADAERALKDQIKQTEVKLKQAEQAIKQAEAAKAQAEAEKKKAEAAKAQAEAAKAQAEVAKQPAMQLPQHVQNKKIDLPDEDKRKITKAWFGFKPTKEKVKAEAKRLRLGAPGYRFTYSFEDSWIKHFGEQLYIEDLVALNKTYDIQPSDIVVYKK